MMSRKLLPAYSEIGLGSLKRQFLACCAVVVLVTALVFDLPLAERHNEHPKWFVHSPESVLNAGADKKLIVSIWMMDFSVKLQMGAVVEKMKKLISDLVTMQTGSLAGLYRCQID
jgi:hypothetical protein